MGIHTWFYKNSTLHKKRMDLLEELENHYSEAKYIEKPERQQMLAEIEEIRETNRAEFHDCFRISKREADGTYCEDVICSKEECDRWLEQNAEFVHDLDRERVDEFWEKYPDGVIDFG